MKKHNQTEISIIESLHQRRETAFSEAYYEYRSYFFNWANKYFSSCSSDQIEDVYQNVWIVLIEKFIWTNRIKVEDGKLIGLTTSLRSFLTTIGRNMLLTEYKKNKRLPIVSLEKKHQNINEEAGGFKEVFVKEELVQQAFQLLKEKEKDLIYYKYVLGYSYEEIRVIMELESANSLKTLCARYMKRFRAHYYQLQENENETKENTAQKKTDSDNQGIPSNSLD